MGFEPTALGSTGREGVLSLVDGIALIPSLFPKFPMENAVFGPMLDPDFWGEPLGQTLGLG